MKIFKDKKEKADSALTKKETKESIKDAAKEAGIPLDLETMDKVAGAGTFQYIRDLNNK